MSLATLNDGLTWLAEHVGELGEVPLRLHDRAIGDDGAPRLSAAFLAYLTQTPFATTWSTETRACDQQHPFGSVCWKCGNQLTYSVTREMYRFPLAAALERLSNVRPAAPTHVSPFILTVKLIACDLDANRAARELDIAPISEDHRKVVEALFLSAIRQLHSRWSSGPIARRVTISDAVAEKAA